MLIIIYIVEGAPAKERREMRMGKGTEALESLTAQVLTEEELEERRAAAESGGDVEATADGRLVRPVPESPSQVQEVTRAPAATWD